MLSICKRDHIAASSSKSIHHLGTTTEGHPQYDEATGLMYPRPEHGRKDDKAVSPKSQNAWRLDFSSGHLTLSIFLVGKTDVALRSGLGEHCEVDLLDGDQTFRTLNEQMPEAKLTPSIEHLRELDFKKRLLLHPSDSRRCTYTGRYRLIVCNSLLVLELRTYQPISSIVASGIFYLPETVRGARNWNSRNSWIRDAPLTVQGSHKMDYGKAAEAYINPFLARLTDLWVGMIGGFELSPRID